MVSRDRGGVSRGWLAGLLALAVFSSACASAYRTGQQQAEQGNWDVAVGKFTEALKKDPNNIKYKLALENARIQASRFHYEEAKKALAANDLDAAANSLEIAAKYDPANRSAGDDLLLVRDRIRKRDEEKRRMADFESMKSRAQAQRVPVAVLSPRSPVPITLKFQDSSIEKIFDSLAKIAGVNILFDEGFRDKKISVNLTGVTFQEAIDQITFTNRLFYKVLDQNTIIIVPESPTKRRAYDEVALRTFYLQNADVNETLNLVKTLAKITTAAGNPAPGGDHRHRIAGQGGARGAHHRGERQGPGRGHDRGADPEREPGQGEGVRAPALELRGAGSRSYPPAVPIRWGGLGSGPPTGSRACAPISCPRSTSPISW